MKSNSLIVYKVTEPFLKKLTSKTYLDSAGRENKIEILGEKQQFVSHAVHPDTGKPYKWCRDDIVEIAQKELSAITIDNALDFIKEFERMAEKNGWVIKGNWNSSGSNSNSNSNINECNSIGLEQDESKSNSDGDNCDDPFQYQDQNNYQAQDQYQNRYQQLHDYKGPAGWSIEKLRDHVMKLDADDYETWIKVGMIINHETQNSREGLQLYDEWSQTSDKYKGFGEVQNKWRSFKGSTSRNHQLINGHNAISNSIVDGQYQTVFAGVGTNAAVTVGSLVKMVESVHQEKARSTLNEFEREILECTEPHELRKSIPKIIAKCPTDILAKEDRNYLAGMIKQRFKKLTDHLISLPDLKKQLRPKGKAVMAAATAATAATAVSHKFAWAWEWVYIAHYDKFFNIKTKKFYSRQSFNAAFNRKIINADTDVDTDIDIDIEGNSNRSLTAERFVLDYLKLKVLDNILYMPGKPLFLEFMGYDCINSYSPDSHPKAKPKNRWTETDQKNIRIITGHFEHLFDNPKDQKILLDIIAWIVQHPDKKIKWSTVIRGAEGDGKTSIAMLLEKIIGDMNVEIIDGNILESNFTGWAKGGLVKFVEEIHFSGQNRHQLMDKLKPFITNDKIPIHPKGIDPYVVPNTANYIMTTNYMGALALTEGDRRYCFLKTKWLTRDQILLFENEYPDYFDNFYKAIEESPAAIRQFFLDYQISDDFNPNKLPQDTAGKLEAIAMSKTPEQEAIEDIIGDPEQIYVDGYLVSATVLQDLLNDDFGDYKMNIHTSKVNQILSLMGYTLLTGGAGRIKIGNRKHKIWVKTPVRLPKENEDRNRWIRNYFANKDNEITKVK